MSGRCTFGFERGTFQNLLKVGVNGPSGLQGRFYQEKSRKAMALGRKRIEALPPEIFF